MIYTCILAESDQDINALTFAVAHACNKPNGPNPFREDDHMIGSLVPSRLGSAQLTLGSEPARPNWDELS